MNFKRSGGILLHPTSLPGRYGIGDLGPQAYRFVDWLASTGCTLWQVLPPGPTGYGDSPYQCFSAFAGNPYLISFYALIEDGLLTEDDFVSMPRFSDERVGYGQLILWKLYILQKAFSRFSSTSEEFQMYLSEERGLDELQSTLAAIMTEDYADASLRDSCKRTFAGQIDLFVMLRRDRLDLWYLDSAYAHLFESHQGRPAESPGLLNLIIVMQFAEGLTDQQAADAVRSRIDWKYALSLPLTHSGFHYSVLGPYRDRLLQGGQEAVLFDKILNQLKERGLLKTRGQQRTDSTHVLAAIRDLNRLACVGQSLRRVQANELLLQWLAEAAQDG